jgi:hypothetical protein
MPAHEQLHRADKITMAELCGTALPWLLTGYK